MGRWIRPRPTPDEVDEWDREATHFYDLTDLPRPIKALLTLIAIPFAAAAAIFAEIGYALHRVISRFAKPSY